MKSSTVNRIGLVMIALPALVALVFRNEAGQDVVALLLFVDFYALIVVCIMTPTKKKP
jgi:hypothetical protein